MVRVAVRVTPWKVLSTGSTLPQDDTNTHVSPSYKKSPGVIVSSL
jgi:hypothetical protein